MNPTDYYKQLQRIIRSFGQRYIQGAYQIEYVAYPHKITVMCDRFDLPNGSHIRFYEDIIVENDTLTRLAYSFSYTRPDSATEGSSFRYEKDPENEDGMTHPLHHLHIGGRKPNNEPRFPTAEMSIIDLFKFVVEQIL